MNQPDPPPVDENDPTTTAVEASLDKIDLQKKPPKNEGGSSFSPTSTSEAKDRGLRGSN
jgi:hypothetical protein